MSSTTLHHVRAEPEVGLGGLIENPRHPAVTRVADVLRSRTPKPRTLLIDDEVNIEQAIRAGVRVDAVYSTADHAATARKLLMAAHAEHCYQLTTPALRSLFGKEKHPRVFALARAPKPASWCDLRAAPGDVLVLDGVRITGNIGAIIRSARAFDAAGVVLVNSQLVSVYDRRLIRASRGLVFSIPVLIAEHTELLHFLRMEEMTLASMSASASAPLQRISEESGRIAILMGSERGGASNRLETAAEKTYAVPMRWGVESLNVSVAAGLALYERQSHTPKVSTDRA